MTRAMTSRMPADRRRALRLAGALIGLAVTLGACKHSDDNLTTAGVPSDYRQRHPIAIQEADRSVVVFVGHARGGLSASQRADVMGLAQDWLREGTGAISIDVPVHTPNARAAADSAVSQNACTDTRGAGAICSPAGGGERSGCSSEFWRA